MALGQEANSDNLGKCFIDFLHRNSIIQSPRDQTVLFDLMRL